MDKVNQTEIKQFLNEKYQQYASPKFIETDPIQIPRAYSRKEDIEISGFLAATISWGQRPQIIKSAQRLMAQMGDSPYQFITSASQSEINSFASFYYRTFNGTDCVAFLKSLQEIYASGKSLELLFSQGFEMYGSVKGAITHFRQLFINNDFPARTTKHISNPMAGSAAKRINMFLRWMVRPPKENVDFGIWKAIPVSELMLPLDVHSGRVSRRLGLLSRKQNDWKAVEEVTTNLSTLAPNDPTKYDFALFGLGIFEKF